MSVSRRATSIVAFSTAAVLSVGLLAGCSSSDSSTETPETASASATATDAPVDASASASPSEDPMVGGDPSTWAPIELTDADNGTTVDVLVGQNARIDGPWVADGVEVTSDKPDVVEPVQGDGVETVPGFTAKAEGDAVIVVNDASGEPIVTYNVRVAAVPTVADDSVVVDEEMVEETTDGDMTEEMVDETVESAPATEESTS